MEYMYTENARCVDKMIKVFDLPEIAGLDVSAGSPIRVVLVFDRRAGVKAYEICDRSLGAKVRSQIVDWLNVNPAVSWAS